ncbi:MAG: SDR family oxidoreductase [Myxococcota bacterium]|jgi:NAD(P)-dependent dehydrogenase (short-subunit alcohol dehydrogenase family)
MVDSKVRFDFEGCRVLVTGGSGGIGLAIARDFRDAGARVHITGTRGGAGDYDEDLSDFEFASLDVRDTQAVEALAASFEDLDVLVNNAGANLIARNEWEPDVFEESVAINLFGAFRLAVRCKPLLAASGLVGGGSVLNVASMSAFIAVPFVPGYGAAKAGLVQMTKNLGVAWAKEGVRVNAVAPGIVDTRMTAGMKGVEVLEKPELERTAMGRYGLPEEIAPAFLFLASPAARFITGTTLCVDGGYGAN